MKFAMLAAVASLFAISPAHAQVYGPPAPEAAQPAPQWSIEDQRIRREAKRTEIVFQALNVVDAVETCVAINSGKGHEANPLLPKKCGGIVAVKAIGGVLHYLLFDHMNDRNPRQARTFARISAGIMGGVVVANLRIVF